MKSEMCMGTMRRKSFQVFDILGYFSHDPVIKKQDSILKAGHLGKHTNLFKKKISISRLCHNGFLVNRKTCLICYPHTGVWQLIIQHLESALEIRS